MMEQLEVLRAELERLFELNELLELSRDVLGFDPESVGGQATLSSFAGALLVHCEKADSIPALVDALLASGHDVSPAVAKVTGLPPVEDGLFGAGDNLGDYRITRKLGEGRVSATYLAKSAGGDVRLRVLHHVATRDARGLQRYLVATRLVGKLDSPAFPALVSAGELDGRIHIAQKYVEGQPLSARVARTGPMHINEARPLVRSIAEALVALHARRISHGALSLDNIITFRGDDGPAAVLLDVATDRLRIAQSHERTGLNSTSANPRSVAPEQFRGATADKASDVYSFGAVLYELLSGKPVFEGSVLDMAYCHLTRTPEAPSKVAPRGWITSDIDELVLRMLSKTPSERGTLKDFLAALDSLGRSKSADDVTAEKVEELEQKLLAQPGSTEVAMALEAAVGRGATADQVGQAFRLAASMIDEPAAVDEKKHLLIRAARLFENSDSALAQAEAVYEELLSIDPRDAVALAGIEEVRRRAGKFEELIEMMLSRAEAAETPSDRARAMAEIGRVYFLELEDNEQAVVAFAQAYCNEPQREYAAEVERAAGTSEPLWAEALEAVGEATTNESLAPEARTQLMLQAGVWYQEKVARPDLAIPCLQAVLGIEPSNERALEVMSNIYRKAQQWQELGMVLTHRADAAATPARARDLRTESAEILEHRLGDVSGARAVYELILSEDPAHEKAGDALARILEKSGDFDILVKLLESRVDAQPHEAALRTICRIGEIYDDHLHNPDEAIRMYRRALEQDAHHLDALRGLERVYTKLGKYQELLECLEGQVAVSATPKQRISLLERIAAVQEEEFLNHEAAAQALKRALESDPGRVGAMANLVRQLRILERWEEASQLYERQLALVEAPAERVALAMAWGRLLADQVGSPERAVHAYEIILEIQPEHAGALEALAKLREAAGDAEEALAAILSLAEQADSPATKAEQYMRAAVLQLSRGNRDAAIESYKRALDAQPEDRSISAALRAAYVERGDINAAVEMLERELDVTEGNLAQARLAGEMARLQRERLRDDDRAEVTAKRALHADPGNPDALLVLGDICFEKERFVEASAHYGRLTESIESLGTERAVPVLIRFVAALSKSGSTENALTAMDTLLRLAPDNMEAVSCVTAVTFEHGGHKRAIELLESFLSQFAGQLSEREKALATYRLGESYRRAGDSARAVPTLREAAELDPGAVEPLVALAKLFEAEEKYAEAVKAKTDQLDVVGDDARIELLVEIGDLYATKLDDHAQAAKSYLAALEERPDERRLMAKLMQLYSEDKDWNKLVEIVVKLAEYVDEPSQKAKYLQTAALVTARQIGDAAQAGEFYEQVLELQPENDKAIKELIDIQRAAGNFDAVEDLLKRQLARAEELDDVVTKTAIYDQLGELYQKHIVTPDLAAEAYETASELDPGNRDRMNKLAAIYDTDPEAFEEKAVLLQEHLLSQNPFRQESYKALRRIYTVTRNADASWALCQVLSVLKLAEPDEQRFYERMRSETAAPAQEAFSEEDWMAVDHPHLDPLVTAVFSLIQPAVIKSRAQEPSAQGVSAEMLIDPSQHEAPLAQTLYYAAGVLGLELPAVYANYEDTGGISHLLTAHPSLCMGQVALSPEVPPQVAAFVATQQLAYLRPGLYMRHFIQTGTGLKSWLFAAIKLISPQFPVAPDLEGSVTEALGALKAHMSSDLKDHLSSVVSKLIQAGTSLDLKKWVGAVDMTTERAALVVCHDLQTATEVVRAADPRTATVPNEERYKQLVLFATSSKFLAVRRRLGITVDD